MENALRYIFILSLVLIFVAYYAGLVTDWKAFIGGTDSFLQTLTGRNASGNFVPYPSNSPIIG